MNVFNVQSRRDQDGRIVEKTETVNTRPGTWTYAYDAEGRLAEARLDGRLVCQCDYDREGRRVRDCLPATRGPGWRNYRYTLDNRLQSAGNNVYTHDDNGFRSIWSSGGTYTLYQYAPDYRLLGAEIEDEDRVFAYKHDKDGRRTAKYLNDQLVEAYQWCDFLRLGAFHDRNTAYEFGYDGGTRLPAAMRREDGTVFTLHYDQIGSLRVVADRSGNVIKEILYDPFGGIIKDTNPALRVPIGFAGGLHDRDLGLIRFGWRDYDANTGRWTAPDPLGDHGGDPDWYGYCLNDPVNANDPMGLFLGWILKQGIRQTTKAGIKKTGKEAAEKSDNDLFKGLDRFLNGKGLDKDPKGSDSDGDGIPDYYDYDSAWNENPEQLEKEREKYHRRKNEQLNFSNHNYGK